MSKKTVTHVRSDGERLFFIDPAREELGEYFIDDDGRKVFKNQEGDPYYFGEVDGEFYPIVICPPFVPVYRKLVDLGGGVSLGNGCFRRGLGISIS